MVTSEAERRQWTQQGAQDTAKRTYDSVKTAISRSPALAGKVDIFLQGSYANATNTRGDSDVDIVVMSTTTYYPDTRLLSMAEVAREQQYGGQATTTSYQFRKLVEQALIAYYGSARVHAKNKCLRVDKRDGYVDADVVPAEQVRRYTSFPAYGSPDWIEGISIQPLQGPRIVNYPKEHRKNGQRKNGLCGEKYKPTVRQLKRLRRRAVEAGLIPKGSAPGYLIECLTYNVPNHLFVHDDSTRLLKVLAWLHTQTAAELTARFTACDEVHHLFVDDPGDHDAHLTIRVLDQLWQLL
ncbi:nucleotidyltransferase-like protein [Micromonospora sp. M71_S20]|uniref:nucleotidyltransferase domain-containing protein n=1 Tax=Micromonospora sp. M71_S20 TaxID=592872 RepID=UPI000F29C138|nr:nucleotidyltransferase [Micromonospora sp. M71_S20]RLK24683.1 nucleotidyltransferase-like protein [Micromonospora sp. M71_S20]